MSAAGHLLEVQGLAVEFHTAGGKVHAVGGVDWHVDSGEVLAILGESGSGKSVSAAAIMNLIDSPPGYVTAGRILYRGEDLLSMSAEARRRINGRRIAMIFQDPLAHLNPVYSVGWQIAETLTAHRAASGRAAKARAIELLDRVGIRQPERRAADYPHQFSGGQRQRVMIAMALALRPEVLIADEPTTALDVTIQAQILTLLKELQGETGMGLILITHDLGVVAEVADRVAVMHEGRIVETGPVRAIYDAPQHPYTQRLMAAIPGRQPLAGRGAEASVPVASPCSGCATSPGTTRSRRADAPQDRRDGARGRRRELRSMCRRDARSGRRVGLRQVHARAHAPAPGRAHRRQRRVPRPGRVRAARRASCCGCGARSRWCSRIRTPRSTRA